MPLSADAGNMESGFVAADDRESTNNRDASTGSWGRTNSGRSQRDAVLSGRKSKNQRGRSISPLEELVFFPGYGYRSSMDWTLVVQGCVFDPRVSWLRRTPLMGFIRHAMRVERGALDFYRERMRPFLVDYARNRDVNVSIAGRPILVGQTAEAGLFREAVAITAAEVAALPRRADLGENWVEFAATLTEGDDRRVLGTVQLLEPRGWSIISDVDDTLKYSNVPNRRDLFHNTFARAFQPIAGMPELYRECHQRGVALHYVSGSPWQLYDPLRAFFETAGLPAGSFHLKRFQIRETARKIRGMSPQRAHKRLAIGPILAAFPERRFVLIGDTGEQDPEIYAEFLKQFPHQVGAVFVRGVRNETTDDARLKRTFANIDPARWSVFRDATDLRERLLACLESEAPV